jgi:predicted ATP-grasp superfamily ATP-dependent carboligase
LQTPELGRAGELPVGGGWLIKPLRAAGGFDIERFDQANAKRLDHCDSMYFQQFISGRSIGATFVGASNAAVFVGATEQLLGPAWSGAREFQYVGSVGPIVLSPEHFQVLTEIGDVIANRFHVQGLFGVDAIINDEGVWPVEVNPRYTASVEVLERALNLESIRWHVAACRRGELPELAPEKSWDETRERHGKAIIYASRELVIDARLERELCAKNAAGADPIVADIPAAGTSIRGGEPIVTVFAKGPTNAHVEEGLRTAMAALHRLCDS